MLKTLALVALATAAHAAPLNGGHWDDRLDLELKEIEVTAGLQLVADVAQVKVVADACVAGRRVDLKLKDVPLHVVLDALTVQLGLRVTGDRDGLRVSCE